MVSSGAIAGMKIAAAPAYSNRRFNPYNALLYEHIRRLVDSVEEFEASPASGNPDILHIHWPDLAIGSARRVRSLLSASVRYLSRLWRCKRRGTRVVWTVHNLVPHERSPSPLLQSLFYRGLFALLDGVIFLSEASREEAYRTYPALRKLPHAVIPHGHYRPVLGQLPTREHARAELGVTPVDQTLFLYFGQIREYKNVPHLMREFAAFAQQQGGGCRLLVAGKPQPPNSPEEREIEQLAREHADSICVDLRHISDDLLHRYLAACDCVVLPYRQILNSGSVLMALSAGRSVIAPHIGSLVEVMRQTGREWIQCYTGEFDRSHLQQALAVLPRLGGQTPDLTPYDWPVIAAKTVDFYHQLLVKAAS